MTVKADSLAHSSTKSEVGRVVSILKQLIDEQPGLCASVQPAPKAIRDFTNAVDWALILATTQRRSPLKSPFHSKLKDVAGRESRLG